VQVVPLTDDQNEHAQPGASEEPLEAWWKNYQARVKESIVAAEQHLEVPAGTITSIPDDPDFIATVKMYAVIEPILNDLIASWQKPRGNPFALLFADQSARQNFRAFVAALNIRGPAGKLKLAKGLGLLPQHQIAFISAVAQVRNRYAHNVKNMHRPLTEIVAEEQQTNGRIVEHLTGVKLPGPGVPPPDLLKRFMYYQLANYLSDAFQTLRPPPPLDVKLYAASKPK
jgi:hypothetical protein